MKMTVQHFRHSNEAEKIVEIEGYNVATSFNAISCLKRELRVMQSMWPTELAGYRIIQRKVKP